MQREIVFSIIIPHKNVSDLLQRCLDSIPLRDDVQVIVVDDNSNPEKVDFEKFPGLNRPNTEVYFDKSGKGAGRARNVGLKHAKGEWVIFADCDDYFHREVLDELMETTMPDDCNAVYWGIEELYPDGSNLIMLTDSDASLSRIPSRKMVLNSFAPWKKMVRRKILSDKKVFFDEIPASNDVMFQMRLMGALREEYIYWYPKVVYTWEKRDNSITTAISKAKAWSRFITSLRANRYALQHGWEMVDDNFTYMKRLKDLSSWDFYYAFYIEWWYLGLGKAMNDYRAICSMDSEHFLLHSNPFMFWGTMKSKIITQK